MNCTKIALHLVTIAPVPSGAWGLLCSTPRALIGGKKHSASKMAQRKTHTHTEVRHRRWGCLTSLPSNRPLQSARKHDLKSVWSSSMKLIRDLHPNTQTRGSQPPARTPPSPPCASPESSSITPLPLPHRCCLQPCTLSSAVCHQNKSEVSGREEQHGGRRLVWRKIKGV